MKRFRTFILLLLVQAGCSGMDSDLTELTNPITGGKIKCPTPKDKEIVRQVTASGALDAKTKRIEEISANISISFEQKITNMREVIPNFQTFEEVDFRMCAANAQGQISNELYEKWLSEFKDKIFFLIKPPVADSDEAMNRLQSDIEKLLYYPNGSRNVFKPPTLIEALLNNKLPSRLFDLLMTYRERDVVRVPNIGNDLQSYMKSYYGFRQESLTLEDNLMTRIGQMVTVRFRNAWAIYLKYIIMRFSGQSKEAIINGGDFLNYDITWDDAERVFTQLSNEPAVAHHFSDLFARYQSLIKDVTRISSAI